MDWTNIKDEEPLRGSIVISCSKSYDEQFWHLQYGDEKLLSRNHDCDYEVYWIYPPEGKYWDDPKD